MRVFRPRGPGGGNGRHARQDPAALPPPGQAQARWPAPAPAPRPVTLGAGASLRAGAAPDAGPAFTGLRLAGSGTPAATISLGGGCEIDVTRTLWLDDLAAAARDARDALTRHAREQEIRAARTPRFTGAEPKTGSGPPERTRQEQLAAYRRATQTGPSPEGGQM
jgi:hypothetical protein